MTAGLLHDLGHLLQDLGSTTLRGVDDMHRCAALPFLRGLFGERVLGSIRLHVDAKRWLCCSRPAYHDALSADSQRSLELQRGTFDAAQAEAFIANRRARRGAAAPMGGWCQDCWRSDAVAGALTSAVPHVAELAPELEEATP